MSETRWDELETVLDTQRLVSQAGSDLRAVAAVIAERIAAITGRIGVVNVVEDDQLHALAATGSMEPIVGGRRPLADSAVRFAFAERETQLVVSTGDDPRVGPHFNARFGEHSMITVPLFRGEEPTAALQIFSPDGEGRLGERERRLLELLGLLFSEAISRAAEQAAHDEHTRALRRLEAIFENAVMAIAVLDRDGLVTDANPALRQMHGRDLPELLGRRLAAFAPPGTPSVGPRMREELSRGERDSASFDHELVRPDGTLVSTSVSLAAARDEAGEILFFVATLQDTTAAREATRALAEQAELNQHQALHDALTGLANRTLLIDRADHAIEDARRRGEQVAVMLMDLDRFKEINDALGHAAGDAVLTEIAERLRGVVRAADTVARLGGDEFAFLLPHVKTADGVLTLAARVRAEVERPVMVDGLPLAVEGSIGIAIHPHDGDDTATLLRRADGAMYAAKGTGRGVVAHADGDGVQDPHRLTLVGELRRALDHDELRLHYQPKAALADGAVRSVEALLRWEHPERGLLPPADFVPLAQETGLIGPITLFVLEAALTQACAWRDDGLPLAVAVNLASRNLIDAGFPDQVRGIIERCGATPGMLELEVTESTMIADPARTKLVLDQLAAMGIRLSIDDFGTGFSSLSYLRSLPVQEIKVDRSFVLGMATDERDAAIVRSTIDLGRNLGLEVVAEGVETQGVWDRLGDLGCTVAQGYLLSRPVPPAELTAWLRERDAAV